MIFHHGRAGLRAGVVALSLLLGACTVGPDYQRPAVEVPAMFKEQDGWKQAEPQQAGSGTDWWSIFSDPVLDGLERQVDVSNQNLKASEAAYRQAVAVAQAANASFFPTITLGGSGTRSQSGGGSGGVGGISFGSSVGNLFNTSVAATWDIDLWGRIRRAVESAEASAQASAADLAAARLSIQGTLAGDYFTLRSADQLKRLFDSTVVAYTQSLQITRNQYAAGVAARSDVTQAEAQLEATQALAINVGIQRAQLEHAIAVLIGKPPAAFSIAPVEGLAQAPAVPVGVPSALLERRPDIAAAEMQIIAANAQIGVAEAAFYPSLNLVGSAGFVSPVIGQLFNTSNNIWSFGPQLSQIVFDGGLLSAQLDQARAAYDQTVALYRQSVLTAFQQVEDQLAALRILAQQREVEDRAVKSADESVRVLLNQYKAGTVIYTTVITAQAAALAAEQTALTIRQNQLTAAVSLVQALGGGWNLSRLPAIAETE